MTNWQYQLVPRFYNLVDEEDSFSWLIIINSINTASTHEQSATGICYLQNSMTLPHWIASGTDYQSVTTNLCRAGTSSILAVIPLRDKRVFRRKQKRKLAVISHLP